MDPTMILGIVSALLPALASCFQKSHAAAAGVSANDPKSYLQAHRNADGTFDPQLVEQARPRTRRAARRQGHRHLSTQDLDQITTQAFQKACDSTDAEVSACMSSAADFHDETDDVDEQ